MKSTVLLIDDNEMILTLLGNCLSDYYTIQPFTSAIQALEVIEQGLIPDLIVTDLNMPGMDGKLLLQTLKSNAATAAIPVMILSGSEKSETRIECLEAGADDFLIKPFHTAEIRVRIQKRLTKPTVSGRIVKPITAKEPHNQPWTKQFLNLMQSTSALLFL